MEQLCFSKMNVGLAILNRRDDGYHNIDTIFQSIMLGDSIYFAKYKDIVFSGSTPELPKYMENLIAYDESNLAMKALRAVQEFTGCKTGGAIHLLKRVPLQAGLGGGSANAAGMIKGLNKFWDLRMTDEEMMKLAKPLGADVAFLMKGGTARATGVGDTLTSLPSAPVSWLLVIKPMLSISTAAAYDGFSGTSQVGTSDMDAVEQAIQEGGYKKAFSLAKNSFEEILFPQYPELEEMKQFFEDRGYPTLMTGSGPTMIVQMDAGKDAYQLQEELKVSHPAWLALITKTKGEEVGL